MTIETSPAAIKRLCADFARAHPAKSAASAFVEACRRPWGETSFAAEKAAAVLQVRYANLCELFESVPAGVEEYFFTRLLEVMQASFDLGMHRAPDGRAARLAHSDQAAGNFVKLVSALLIYLKSHPELEPKASENFANIIRPDILELFGKSRKAPSKTPPSLSALVKALRSVRKRSFVL